MTTVISESLQQNKYVVGISNDNLPQQEDVLLVFDVLDSEEVTLRSQITDHYVEDNTAIQDCWALEPIRLRLGGKVGELVYESSLELQIQEVLNNEKLTAILQIAPILTNYAQVALNAYKYLRDSFKRYQQVYERLRGSEITGASVVYDNSPQENFYKQIQAYNKLRQLRELKQLVKVKKCAFGDFNDYAIEDISLRQDESRYYSELRITLKQWRTASTETSEVSDEYADRVKKQRSQMESYGKAGSVEKDSSTLYSLGGVGN